MQNVVSDSLPFPRLSGRQRTGLPLAYCFIDNSVLFLRISNQIQIANKTRSDIKRHQGRGCGEKRLQSVSFRRTDADTLNQRSLGFQRVTSSPVVHDDVALLCESDEQWSFVGSKAQQRWLWYAYNTKTGSVLSYTFGPGTDETCRELLAQLMPFNIGMLITDKWGSYVWALPKEKHLTGKIFTQRIERNNLTLRTRIKRLARKTICFSRSVELHGKVIGAFIEKHMLY